MSLCRRDVACRKEVKTLTEFGDDGEDTGRLLLSQHIDLEVHLCPSVRKTGLLVLADEDEGRKKDGFQKDDDGEQRPGEPGAAASQSSPCRK